MKHKANSFSLHNPLILFVYALLLYPLLGLTSSYAQFVSKWNRVEGLAESLFVGKGETALEVARRLGIKDEICDILYAEESNYPIYYVDRTARGSYDGSSWENAFRTIQPAIDAATANEGWVWVADGVYESAVYGYDRYRLQLIGAIHLKPRVMLFGGFSGNETSLNQRDPESHETVIIAATEIVRCRGVFMDHETLIDGFTIRDSGFFDYSDGGTADWITGGGIKTGNWFAIIRNNRFHGNYAKGGGGISAFNRDNAYNIEGYSPIIEHNVIYENHGVCGNGIQVRHCEALVCNNVVVYNTAENEFKRKGIENVLDPNISDPPIIVNTISWGNTILDNYCDIYNHIDHVRLFGDGARAYSWNNCLEYYREEDNHINLITDDPLFADPNNHDYSVLSGSPCIDAGLAEGPADPDGTRADIGLPSMQMTLNEISLVSGWNWFSMNLCDEDMSPNTFLASLEDNGEFIKDQSTSAEYVGGFGWFSLNGLENLTNTTSYKIRMSTDDVLELQGFPVDCSNTPINLVTGWNWLGYLPQESNAVTSALASIEGNGEFIKNQTSSAEYVPGFGWFSLNGLDEMQPGDGYVIRMISDDVLVYPEAPPVAKRNTSPENRFSITGWSVNSNEFEHSMIVTGALMLNGEELMDDGYTIGAFVDGECRGMASPVVFPVNERFLFAMLIHGEAGETISFKVHHDGNDTEFDVLQSMRFEPNGIVGSLKDPFLIELTTAAIPKIFRMYQNYPNPFNTETSIRYDLPHETDFTMDVFNLSGQHVDVLHSGRQNAGSYTFTWDATGIPSGAYIVRIQAGEFVQMRKCVLLK